MSHKFVTVRVDDPKGQSYLTGDFSSRQRALPVQSMAYENSGRRLTLEIVPLENLKAPSLLLSLLKSIRPGFFPLTLLPALLVLCTSVPQGLAVNWTSLGLSLVTMVWLHGAVFTMNDYSDHLKGLDALSGHRGSGVLQKGWLSARQLRGWSYILLALSVTTGLWLLTIRPGLFYFGLVALLGPPIFSLKGRGLKYLGFGDLWTFLLLGPVLFSGYGWSIYGEWSWASFYWGFPMGLCAMLVFQLRQIQRLFAEKGMNSGTLVARLGFDKSKGLVVGTLISAFGFYFIVGVSLASTWIGIGALLFCSFALAIGLGWKSWKWLSISSPVSSSMRRLRMEGLSVYLFFSAGILIFSLASLPYWSQ